MNPIEGEGNGFIFYISFKNKFYTKTLLRIIPKRTN